MRTHTQNGNFTKRRNVNKSKTDFFDVDASYPYSIHISYIVKVENRVGPGKTVSIVY